MVLRPLLLIGGAWAVVERHLRDDVLLAEAAGVDPRDRERVERVEARERVVDDLLCLVELHAIGARRVEQQIDARVARGGRRTSRMTAEIAG